MRIISFYNLLNIHTHVITGLGIIEQKRHVLLVLPEGENDNNKIFELYIDYILQEGYINIQI